MPASAFRAPDAGAQKFGWLQEAGWRESKVDTLRRTDLALAELLSSAVRGHPLTGEQAGQLPGKEGKLRTVEPQAHGRNCAQWSEYSLHANTRVGELARAELEKLCRPPSRRDMESRLARCAHRGVPSSAARRSRPAGSASYPMVWCASN